MIYIYIGFPGGSHSKASACNAGDPGSIYPWSGKIPWRRKWQSAPVLLPGKFHGQRSLVGYSPWGRKESDMTEPLHSLMYIYTHTRQNLETTTLIPRRSHEERSLKIITGLHQKSSIAHSFIIVVDFRAAQELY